MDSRIGKKTETSTCSEDRNSKNDKRKGQPQSGYDPGPGTRSIAGGITI